MITHFVNPFKWKVCNECKYDKPRSMKIKYIVLKLIAITIISLMNSCDSGDGLFGHSKSIEEARSEKYGFRIYVSDIREFKLIDGSRMLIDTAWREVSFTYKNGKKIPDSLFGYNFSIPYKFSGKQEFKVLLRLMDSSNVFFTNGMNPDVCFLRPKRLYDTMNVLLEQKNPDTSLGWLKPIISDTINFIRLSQ